MVAYDYDLEEKMKKPTSVPALVSLSANTKF